MISIASLNTPFYPTSNHKPGNTDPWHLEPLTMLLTPPPPPDNAGVRCQVRSGHLDTWTLGNWWNMVNNSYVQKVH